MQKPAKALRLKWLFMILLLISPLHSVAGQDRGERRDWRADRNDRHTDRNDWTGHIRANRYGDIYHLRNDRGRIIGTIEDGILDGEKIVKDRRGRRIGVIKEK